MGASACHSVLQLGTLAGPSTETECDPRVSRRARMPAASALDSGRHCVKAVSLAGAVYGSGATSALTLEVGDELDGTPSDPS